jgi:hypothetical protein
MRWLPVGRRARWGPGLALALVLVAVVSVPGVLAVFSDAKTVGSNTFTTPACLRAEFKAVQQGTATSSADGTTTVTINTVDPTKAYLLFSLRSNLNRPPGSTVRGRLASATTVEFLRVTDETSTITIQWQVIEYTCGVSVQRGETVQNAASTDVAITPVTAVSQAFVTWSKTTAAGSGAYDLDDTVVGELTSTSNLQLRSGGANSSHIIWWQVIEYTRSADIQVRKGTTSLTGAATSTTATISPAVDVTRTFVLVGGYGPGSGSDIGARQLRARLTNSTTITFDRSITGDADDLSQIFWQAVELKDGSTVQHGSASFASGTATATAALATVNTARSVAFASTQDAAGLSGGRSSYAGDDIPGVAQATVAITSPTQVTLTRNNTAAAADIAWFVVSFPGYRQSVLFDSPVSYWRFGEAAGSTAADEQGANNGTYTNSPTLAQSGVLVGDANTAVSFDGTDDRTDVAYAAGLNPDKFTVEAWARPTGGAGTNRAVVASYNEVGGVFGYGIWAASDNTWKLYVGNGSARTTVTGPAVTLNAWTHLVGTYDGTTASLYVNGNLAATTAVTYASNATAPLGIGAWNNSGTWQQYFPGRIDEVAVYKRALSLARVQMHYSAYRAEVLTDTPTAYWRLGEASGTTAADEKATYPGTYANTPTLAQAGALNGDADTSVSFDGTAVEYVSRAYNAALNPAQFTVEAWAKPNGGGAGNWRGVAGTWYDNGAGTIRGYGIWLSNAGAWLAATNGSSVTGPAATMNTWTHLAMTYDGTAIRLYVNGSLAASQATGYTANTSGPFVIGAFNYPARPSGGWDDEYYGQIDEVALYSTALSATRIQAHYEAR